jgi:hypothetical protein
LVCVSTILAEIGGSYTLEVLQRFALGRECPHLRIEIWGTRHRGKIYTDKLTVSLVKLCLGILELRIQ